MTATECSVCIVEDPFGYNWITVYTINNGKCKILVETVKVRERPFE